MQPWLIAGMAGVAVVLTLWILRVRATRFAARIRPLRSILVSAGPGDGPPPDDNWRPTFDRPTILGDVLPLVPECGLTYPIVYTDLSEWLGDCNDAGSTATSREAGLLARARDQARRFCLWHPAENCQGVTELAHSFTHSCFTVAGTTYLNAGIVYLFRCSKPGPPVVYTPDNPPPSSAPPPPPPDPVFPECSGSYHYIAHDISEVPAGCASPDIAAIEQRKAGRLHDAAVAYAASFCRGAQDPACRLHGERGYHVSHHCFRSAPMNATYHVSTIVYFFSCPMTI